MNRTAIIYHIFLRMNFNHRASIFTLRLNRVSQPKSQNTAPMRDPAPTAAFIVAFSWSHWPAGLENRGIRSDAHSFYQQISVICVSISHWGAKVGSKAVCNQYPRHQPTSILPIFVIRNPSLELKLGLVFAVVIFNVSRNICHLQSVR